MIIEEVSKDKYTEIVEPVIFFNSIEFNELNRHKVDEVKYLLFKDTKYRLGLCIGINSDSASCPFSAPFGSFVKVRSLVTIKNYDDAVHCLDDYLKQQGINKIRFILPPAIYDVDDLTLQISALKRSGYELPYVDLNYYIDLVEYDEKEYIDNLPQNGRKNLRIASESGLRASNVEPEEEIISAYGIINENRRSKGYPLRMSYDDVKRTLEIVGHDCFIVYKNEVAIASAIVYRVSKDIAQVIYWGDIPGVGEYKPINFLAYELFQYYKKLGYRYLDIGPSSERGEPNYGLCDFKASIGCHTDIKFTMSKGLING